MFRNDWDPIAKEAAAIVIRQIAMKTDKLSEIYVMLASESNKPKMLKDYTLIRILVERQRVLEEAEDLRR